MGLFCSCLNRVAPVETAESHSKKNMREDDTKHIVKPLTAPSNTREDDTKHIVKQLTAPSNTREDDTKHIVKPLTAPLNTREDETKHIVKPLTAPSNTREETKHIVKPLTAPSNTREDDTKHIVKPLTAPSNAKQRNDLLEQLRKLTDSLKHRLPDYDATLSTLIRIFDKILQHPNDEKYRQIKLTDETFNSKVWQYPAGEKLMRMSGWVVEDDYVRLTDDSCVQIVSQLLMQFQHDCEYGKTIINRDGKTLRRMLQQAQIPVTNIRPYGLSLLNFALTLNEIGIARILIKEYSIDVNAIDDQKPCIFYLTNRASESVIIEFIKEFNVNVNVCMEHVSLLNRALLCKCFKLIQYLIEECKVDVNAPINTTKADELRFTTLHIAYAINEPAIANYLIKHGANVNAIDIYGRKPMEYEGSHTNILEISKHMVNFRKVHKNNNSPEYKYYKELRGVCSENEAISRTIQMYPSLQGEEVPTLNKLNCYIIDMATKYYEIGLQLDIVNSQLKLIKCNSGMPDFEEKCRKMLEVWLENDTSATWKKLCDALKEQGLSVLAEQIKHSQCR